METDDKREANIRAAIKLVEADPTDTSSTHWLDDMKFLLRRLDEEREAYYSLWCDADERDY